jgi:hypothetical protein
MQRKRYDGKTMPVNSAVTAEMSPPGGKIPLNPWNYIITNFCCMMYNWNGGMPSVITQHLLKSTFNAAESSFRRNKYYIIINQDSWQSELTKHKIDIFDSILPSPLNEIKDWMVHRSFTDDVSCTDLPLNERGMTSPSVCHKEALLLWRWGPIILHH